MPLKYRDTVLAELARHGVLPRDETPPEFIHEFINDLYRYEIRRLRARLLAGEIAKKDYAAHVERLRNLYPILSLPVRYWREGEQ
jgi:hypothetical protein